MERKFFLETRIDAPSALRATERDMLKVVKKYNHCVFTERELQAFAAFLRERNRKLVADNPRRKVLDINSLIQADQYLSSFLLIGSLSVTLLPVFDMPEEFTAYLKTFAK